MISYEGGFSIINLPRSPIGIRQNRFSYGLCGHIQMQVLNGMGVQLDGDVAHVSTVDFTDIFSDFTKSGLFDLSLAEQGIGHDKDTIG